MKLWTSISIVSACWLDTVLVTLENRPDLVSAKTKGSCARRALARSSPLNLPDWIRGK